MTPDVLKMWPWMRDLPTQVWSGRGWVPTDDGDMCNLTQLPGRGWCKTPGARVWEAWCWLPVAGKRRRLEELAGASQGTDSGGPHGAVAGDPQPSSIGAGSSHGPPRLSGPGGSDAGSAPTADPACGVRPQGDLGISWHSGNKGWRVTHRVHLGDGTSKQIQKYFCLGPHRGTRRERGGGQGGGAARHARVPRRPGGLRCALGRQQSSWSLQRRPWRKLGPKREALASKD